LKKPLLFIFLTFLSFSCQEKPLTINDFIIIEITDEVLNKYNIPSDISYDQIRYRFRELHTIFLRNVRDLAKFIILDFFYDDHGIEKIDNKFINELYTLNNVCICAGGIYKGDLYSTHSSFSNASKYTGHTFYQKDNLDGYWVPKYKRLPVNNDDETSGKDFKYVSIILLNHLNIDCNFRSYVYVKSDEINRFKRINFTNFLKNTNIAKNKIVILIAQLKDNLDMHDIPNYGKITGPELICNTILKNISN